jgi:hypothetical protein
MRCDSAAPASRGPPYEQTYQNGIRSRRVGRKQQPEASSDVSNERPNRIGTPWPKVESTRNSWLEPCVNVSTSVHQPSSRSFCLSPQPYSPYDFCIPQDFVRLARDGGGHAQLVYDCQLFTRVSTLGPERTGNTFQSSLTRFSPSSYVRQSMYGCFPLTLCFVGKCKTNELVIRSKEDEFVPASKLVAPPAVVWLHQWPVVPASFADCRRGRTDL